MNEDIKKLSDEAGALHDKQARIYADAKDEKRDVTEEEEARFDDLHKQEAKKQKSIEQLTKLAEANYSKEEEIRKIADVTQKSVAEVVDNKEKVQRALKSFLCVGLDRMNSEDREVLTRAQATSPDSAGGYTIPKELANEIVQSLQVYGGVRQVARILGTSKGNQLDFPTNNDIANVGALLSENAAAAEQDTAFGTKEFNAYKYTTKIIRVSRELLQDSAFDIEQHIRDIYVDRIGRITNTHYTTGTGSSQPEGIVTGSTFGTAAAAITATTFSEMLDLKHSVDPAYRVNGSWMFNDATLLTLKKISLASANQSLWQPGIVGGEPATIDGQKYTINNDMPSMAAGTHPVLYGDMSKFLVRDVLGLQIFRSSERYFENDQVAFVGFMRTDSGILDSAAIKHMRMSNT